MKMRIRYVAYTYIFLRLVDAILLLSFNVYTHTSDQFSIMITVWHLMNVVIWIGIIKRSRVCYRICVSLMILYCMGGVTGLILFITGSPLPNGYDLANIEIYILGLAVVGHYPHLLLGYISSESFLWMAPVIYIVLSALPLWILVLDKAHFMHRSETGEQSESIRSGESGQ